MNSIMDVARMCLFGFIITLSACADHVGVSPKQYYTWGGLEPDRWSSIWLVKRHLDPSAEINIVPLGARLRGAEALGTPDANIKRTSSKSVYENLLATDKENRDPVLTKIGNIINQLEVSPWGKTTPMASVVERQFRNLQYRYNRVDVPIACYSGFFDALYSAIKNDAGDVEKISKALDSDRICKSASEAVAKKSTSPVLEYSTNYVLNLINTNKKVVFVDTREAAEYDENHIPGAINIKLRDVNNSVVPDFDGADLVIAYCIKDFRGYEVALALSKLGVKHTGIMNPYGLKGWLGLGLPVADAVDTDTVALGKLKRRAARGI